MPRTTPARTETEREAARQASEQLANETAAKIVSLFQTPEKLPAALSPVFIHRKDCRPSRAWCFPNQLLVALTGHYDARGFRQWQDVSRFVKKGEKSFRILSPIMKSFTKRDPETGEKKKINFVCGFTTTPVFGLSQTDGADLAEDSTAVKYNDWLKTIPFRSVADHWGLAARSLSGLGELSPPC